LNYRDLIIPKGKYPFPVKDGVVPGSDAAGTVEAVGPRVTRFKLGGIHTPSYTRAFVDMLPNVDKVVTLFNQGHLGGSLDRASIDTGLGGVMDGTLREYAVFDEQGLVHAPLNLNWLEASTLSCAAVTAWNALYGLESRALKPGQVIPPPSQNQTLKFTLE